MKRYKEGNRLRGEEGEMDKGEYKEGKRLGEDKDINETENKRKERWPKRKRRDKRWTDKRRGEKERSWKKILLERIRKKKEKNQKFYFRVYCNEGITWHCMTFFIFYFFALIKLIVCHNLWMLLKSYSDNKK